MVETEVEVAKWTWYCWQAILLYLNAVLGVAWLEYALHKSRRMTLCPDYLAE
jgi:hypothetical protein